MVIDILVKNKRATLSVPSVVICGNSDYSINFSFDDEWEAYDIKTARFFHGGNYTEVVFTGSTCDVPILSNASGVYVGVYAGDLHTTTPAYIPCEKSILCMGGGHEEPEEDVYNQLMQTLSEMNDCIPIPQTAEVGQLLVVKAVDENGKPTEWKSVGVNGEWVLATSMTTEQEYNAIFKSTTDNGTPYDFEEIVGVIRVPIATKPARLIITRKDGAYLYRGYTGYDISTTKSLKMIFFLSKMQGTNRYLLNVACSSSVNQSWNEQNVQARSNIEEVFSDPVWGEYIDSIMIATENKANPLPIGTEIKIYGRVK